MRSLISPNCFILFIWFLSKTVIIMTPAIARAMSITRIETTIIPKDNFDAVSGGEDPLTHWAMDTQLTRLVLKYYCGGR